MNNTESISVTPSPSEAGTRNPPSPISPGGARPFLIKGRVLQDRIEAYVRRRFTIQVKPKINTQREQRVLDLIGAVSLIMLVLGLVQKNLVLIAGGLVVFLFVLFDPGYRGNERNGSQRKDSGQSDKNE